MKIVVNCFDLLDSRSGSGGGGKYVASLLPELARKAEVRVISSPKNGACFRHDDGYTVLHLPEMSYQAIMPLLDWADVYFCPLNGLSPPFLDSRIPIVCTILDLQQIHFPHFFGGGMFEARHIHYGTAIARADAVLTISHFEQDNIRRTYKKDAVYVAHLSGYLADEFLGQEVNPSAELIEQLPWDGDERYLLYPAVPWSHKNHGRLLQAFDIMLRREERFANYRLVLTGARQHSMVNNALSGVIEQYRLSRNVADLGFVNDTDLTWLMTNAAALVFPSLYEGFGIPLVDAMKFGIPAIAARVGSVHEVCGDAIAYFSNPLDARSMACELTAFLDDEKRQQNLREAGIARGAEFNAEATADATLGCFTAAVAARRNCALPQVYLPTRTAEHLPRETVTVVIDATGFDEAGAANKALDRLLDGIGNIADSLRWAVLMNETDDMPAIARLPSPTVCGYARRELSGSRAVQLAMFRDEVISTDQILYLLLDQTSPAVFNELGYAAAMLKAFPEVGGVRFEPRASHLWIDLPYVGKALINMYEEWSVRPLSFFHNQLLRRSEPVAATCWTREGVRDILGRLQILVLPLRRDESLT